MASLGNGVVARRHEVMCGSDEPMYQVTWSLRNRVWGQCAFLSSRTLKGQDLRSKHYSFQCYNRWGAKRFVRFGVGIARDPLNDALPVIFLKELFFPCLEFVTSNLLGGVRLDLDLSFGVALHLLGSSEVGKCLAELPPVMFIVTLPGGSRPGALSSHAANVVEAGVDELSFYDKEVAFDLESVKLKLSSVECRLALGRDWSDMDSAKPYPTRSRLSAADDAEDQVHQSALVIQSVPSSNLRLLSSWHALPRSREAPMIAPCTTVSVEDESERMEIMEMGKSEFQWLRHGVENGDFSQHYVGFDTESEKVGFDTESEKVIFHNIGLASTRSRLEYVFVAALDHAYSVLVWLLVSLGLVRVVDWFVCVLAGLVLLTIIVYAAFLHLVMAESTVLPTGSFPGPFGHVPSLGSKFLLGRIDSRLDLFCSPESREHLGPKEHLGLVEVESILAQVDFSGQNHSSKNADDQDLGSWKLSEVIARYSRRAPMDGNLNAWPSLVHHCQSETESDQLRRDHPESSQSDSIASEFALSRDRVGYVSTETKSNQSLPRESRHSTLDALHKTLFFTLSHNLTHCVLERIDLGNFTTGESNFYEHQEAGSMENNDKTLKKLATPDVVYQPWCIQCPSLEPAQSYELKSSLIHLLPKLQSLVGEDPHKHLNEFHVVCSTMRLQGIPEDHIKMKAFLFSLDGAAKDWLYLQPILFNTWGDIKRMFLEKFFLASRTATIKKEICGIKQHSGETLHQYWERFNKLCATCLHHQISEYLLIRYFYEGLMIMDRSMIDVASGGALIGKMPAVARHLISNMASNTQQFGTRGTVAPRMVNDVGTIDNPRLEN
ncbi:hypothetical protein CR513_47308, partial [Mucuna pruriens]